VKLKLDLVVEQLVVEQMMKPLMRKEINKSSISRLRQKNKNKTPQADYLAKHRIGSALYSYKRQGEAFD
jgi:hypothetical protein